MKPGRQFAVLSLVAAAGAVAIRPADVLPAAGRFITPLFAQQASPDTDPNSTSADRASAHVPVTLPAFLTAPREPEVTAAPAAASAAPSSAVPSTPSATPLPPAPDTLAHAPTPPSEMLVTPAAPAQPAPTTASIADHAPVGPASGPSSDPAPAASSQTTVAAVEPDGKAPSSTSPVKSDAPAPDGAAPALEEPATRPLIAAKTLFGAAKVPANLAPKAIGSYARGCLAGAQALPTDGPAWQAMRLSRNRNWGHPRLISLVEKFASDAQKLDGWPGLLVGDISQPRGGPMLTGHASHQVGLDADVWLTPMPDHKLTSSERENINATSMLDGTDLAVDPKVFTDKQVKLIKRAASYPEVERILVHPAIKKALCLAAGPDRGWLGKVRPMQGHYYHFHMRIGCPPGSDNCSPQKPPTGEDGCTKEVEEWLARVAPAKGPPAPKPPGWKPPPPKPPLSIAQLPAECTAVLESGPSGVPVPAQAKLDVRVTIKAPAALKPHLRKLRAAGKT